MPRLGDREEAGVTGWDSIWKGGGAAEALAERPHA